MPTHAARQGEPNVDGQSKRQKSMAIALEASENSITSSFVGAVSEASFDVANKVISINVSSASTNEYVNAHVRIEPILGRVGIRMHSESSPEHTRDSIKITKQLSLPMSDSPTEQEEPGAFKGVANVEPHSSSSPSPCSSSQAAETVAAIVKAELKKVARYGNTRCCEAKNPTTEERAVYKVDVSTNNTSVPRIDIKFSPMENESATTKVIIYEKSIVDRVVKMCKLEPNEDFLKEFWGSTLTEDVYQTDEEPWKLSFLNCGAIALNVQLPADEFTEGEDLHVLVAQLYVV